MWNKTRIAAAVVASLSLGSLVVAPASAEVRWTGTGWATSDSTTLFPKGSTALTLGGGAAIPSTNAYTKEANVFVAFDYFFADNLSIGPSLQARYIKTEGHDAIGGDFTPFFRWHFLTSGKFTFFVDVGGGIGYYDKPIPEGATRFNFNGQFGPGFTYKLEEDLHLIGGFRFLHYSNGNVQGPDRHDSVNEYLFHLGVMWTF